MVYKQKTIFSDRSEFKKRKRYYVLVSIVLTVAIMTLLVTPILIKKSITDWLISKNAQHIKIADVDFNYLTATLVIEGLQFEKPKHEPLRVQEIVINVDWIPLLAKNLYFGAIELNESDINYSMDDSGNRMLNGIILESSTREVTPTKNDKWKFGIHRFNIINSKLKIDFPLSKSTINIDQFSLENLAQWLPGQLSTFQGKLTINNAPISFEGSTRPFSDKKPLDAYLTAINFDLIPYEKLINSESFKINSGSTDLQLKVSSSLNTDNQYEIGLDGNISLNSFTAEVDHKHHAVDLAKLSWDGKSELVINRHSGNASFFTDGELEVDHADINSNYPHGKNKQTINTTVTKLSFIGDTNFNFVANQEADPFHMSGNINITSLNCYDPDQNIVLAHIQQSEITGFEFSAGKRLEIPTLSAINASIMGSKPTPSESFDDELDGNDVDPVAFENKKRRKDNSENNFLLNIGKTIIDNVTVNFGSQALIANITLSEINSQIVRNKNGKLLYISNYLEDDKPNIQNAGNANNTDETKANISTTPSKLQIGVIKIKDDSRFVYKDYYVSPYYQTNARHINMNLTALDTSSEESKSTIEFSATLDEATKVNISGTVQPFKSAPDANLKSRIEQLELYPLSSYSAQLLGYEIKSGTLSMDSTIKINKGKLNSKNTVFLNRIKLGKKRTDKTKPIDDGMPLSFASSLDLLRDNKNNIKLNLPVHGDLTHPDFDILPAINKATQHALQSSTIVYLSYTLQPWGAIASAASLADSNQEKVSLSPMFFQPGKSDKSSINRKYSSKIANLLREKPGLSLTLCGISSLQDKKAIIRQANDQNRPKGDSMKSTLLNMAKRRETTLRIHFIKDRNIAPERLFRCKPMYKPKNIKPSVEISVN